MQVRVSVLCVWYNLTTQLHQKTEQLGRALVGLGARLGHNVPWPVLRSISYYSSVLLLHIIYYNHNFWSDPSQHTSPPLLLINLRWLCRGLGLRRCWGTPSVRPYLTVRGLQSRWDEI